MLRKQVSFLWSYLFFGNFSEQEILREEIQSLQTVKSKLQEKVKEMENEMKKVREETEKNDKAHKLDDEVGQLF